MNKRRLQQLAGIITEAEAKETRWISQGDQVVSFAGSEPDDIEEALRRFGYTEGRDKDYELQFHHGDDSPWGVVITNKDILNDDKFMSVVSKFEGEAGIV